MGQGVWVFAEHGPNGTENITLELISEAKKLARRLKAPLCACVIGADVSGVIETLCAYGIETVYVVENESLANYDLDAYSHILARVVGTYDPALVMVGATPTGAELAPRAAAKLKIPCITHVKKITGGKDGFKITKSEYDDQVYAHVLPETESPLVITIPPGETDVAAPGRKKTPEIIHAQIDFSDWTPRSRTGRFINGDPRTIGIAEAGRIVAGGRGAGESGFPVLQELADALAAAMAGSRGAVDDGLVPVVRQIGISGKTVIPKLLVVCGISGAREFTVGMENSDLVIAINTDAKARIFEFANLCINGDLNEVIPAVLKRLQSV